jgi:ABC-type transporter Mla subunit MlaD
VPDVNQGIINYGRIGGDASVHHETVYHGGGDDRVRLDALIASLSDALARLPAEHRETAEAVSRQAESLAELTREAAPNKTLLRVASDGLKQTVKFLADVAPPVAGIVEGIVKIAAALGGA